MVLGLALITIALFLLPRSSGFGSIAAYLFLLGLGGGIIVTAANALGSDVSPEHRGTTLNLLNLFFGLGGLATPFISANLLSRNAVKLCYLVAGLTAATLLVNIATAMPQPTGAQSFVFSQVGDVVGRPTLWLLALFLFLYVASEVGVWNWLVQHLMAQGIAESSALNVLSLGFALGLLIGRVGVSQILKTVSPMTVTLGAAILMAITTYLMLQTRDPKVAWILVFLAGVAMAPVFPTTLAMVGDAFPRMTGTAMGIVITSGWIGLAVSSRIIGSIAGGDSKRLKKALLVLPVMAVMMIAVNLTIQAMTSYDGPLARGRRSVVVGQPIVNKPAGAARQCANAGALTSAGQSSYGRAHSGASRDDGHRLLPRSPVMNVTANFGGRITGLRIRLLLFVAPHHDGPVNALHVPVVRIILRGLIAHATAVVHTVDLLASIGGVASRLCVCARLPVCRRLCIGRLARWARSVYGASPAYRGHRGQKYKCSR
jgi:fucose permease